MIKGDQNTEVVVIGSGISGLTAAALLARKGREVTILERTARPGGALKRFKRQGVSFDVGFHYTGCLGEGEILAVLWDYLGVRSRLEIRPFPADGHDALHITGCARPVRAYFNYSRLAEELQRLFPAERAAITAYLEQVKQVCREVPFYNLDLPLSPFLRGFKERPQALAEYLRAITDNPQLQAALAAPVFLYGVPPEAAAFPVHATVAHGFYQGAYTIDGGGQAVVDAYLQVLDQAGARVLTGNRVVKVLVEHDRVAGVVTDREQVISCREVIFTGHPAAVPAMVPAALFRPIYLKRLQELQNTCSMHAVFAVPDGPEVPPPDWNNYYKLPAGLDIIAQSREQALRHRALMMTSPERRETGSLREPNRGIILLSPAFWREGKRFWASTPRNRPADYEAWKEEVTGEMLAATRQHWGDRYGSLRPLAVGTPLTFRDELAAPEGAAYGAQHSLLQHNPVARTRLPGFWLSGQSTLMTGVVGAALAGLVSAGEILEIEKTWEEVRQCR
ncbi:phytoene desaturase family protein [Desulfurivibrio alkaliphilus]|uniref:All-trans-retinol 13,14-reductase n=1 Tax=Desulfurivibrio alkaliphilus (strain DSM 19089 / UNIQEM U267 / AHT2) TaxID=589865 RepID=D6Z2Q8_DESAT|nr:NAD(P)/FAD-dependent oxidoreductase [Desulfurivibrio alkaliphilus]ADH85833.1 All-trans-retinol 13,14-reductase [Desulfurivibrio alkaliphilus AHT 2]